ncbi:MAG: putative transcriptional regulator, partial [Sporomusa sp.]|nr:putative transcriptional regulator [Sporomusa sp.]
MNDFEQEYGKCPMYYTLSILEGKWKWIILWEIFRAEVIRYSHLKAHLQPIAHK